MADQVKPPADEEYEHPSPLHGQTQQLSFRVKILTYDVLKRRAAETGLPIGQYVRELIERDVLPDPDAKFLAQLQHWWGFRGQGDPNQIVGARFRAEGAGMTFAFKFRMMVKQFLDLGLI